MEDKELKKILEAINSNIMWGLLIVAGSIFSGAVIVACTLM